MVKESLKFEQDLACFWLDYYRNNRESLLHIPWERGGQLTESERDAIASSVREFQLGENAEGKHLIRCARQFAASRGAPAYAEAIELFIAEEQRHSRDLGRFMDLAGIRRAQRAWPHLVFRRLRHFGGLDLSISVLITAEIIAKVYYAALREATASTVLRGLCDQILRDEREHVRFQCDYLAILRRDRRRWLFRLTETFHRILYFGACLVVWKNHHTVIRRGGMTFRRYWRSCRLEMHSAMEHVRRSAGFLRLARCPGPTL